jgi:hypothetical protein
LDNRIRAVLTYKNLNRLNQEWGKAKDVLMAVDIENEPFIQARNSLETQTDDASGWLCNRANVIKSAPDVLVSTGGTGGDNGLDSLHWGACPNINIIALHVCVFLFIAYFLKFA